MEKHGNNLAYHRVFDTRIDIFKLEVSDIDTG